MDNLSASILLDIQLKAEAMWTDSRMSADLKGNADAAIAVLTHQTARFAELTEKDKDRKVKVMWLDPCGTDAEDCEPNCDLDEPELDSKAQEYELDICKKSGFSIDREIIRTNQYEFQEQAALGILKAKKALDEYWAKQILVKLKSFAGVNVQSALYPYDAANNTTNIPEDKYNVKLVTYLMKQMILNKMPAGYMIDNGALWDVVQNALIDGGNLDGKGDSQRASFLKNLITFDLFNFLKAGISEDTFLVGTGAVAFKTKTRNPDKMTEMGGKVGQTWYTVDSDLLPGVKYDVYYEMNCKTVGGETRSRITDTWRLETQGGIFLNPKGCPVTVGGTTYDPTGVLSFTQIAASV